MADLVRPDRPPIAKRRSRKIDDVESPGSGPFLGLVIISQVPELLEFIEGAGNALNVCGSLWHLAGNLAVGKLLGSFSHWPMIESPCQLRTLVRSLPITYRFPNQQVKQSIVCCRNGSPQASLFGFCSFAFGKMIGLLKQVFGECHCLGPRRLFELGLL